MMTRYSSLICIAYPHDDLSVIKGTDGAVDARVLYLIRSL